ncbi:ferredoxin [Nocardia miyunensis]|uniref:ferredoxin n=1 Tax=Nocardia miyunensis TaxID=282684 RepID=UPI00083139D1|nr:ferredoxin [Nocardia miyunensis]
MNRAESSHGEWQLHIDWTRCDGRGVCTELLPGVLGRDDWGFPLTRDHRDPVVGTDRIAAARDAVDLCPRLALRLDRTRRT